MTNSSSVHKFLIVGLYGIMNIITYYPLSQKSLVHELLANLRDPLFHIFN